MSPHHVVGLDIGDGESCLAWLATDSAGAASVFSRPATGERSIVTAMAIGPDGRRVIGESALVTAEAVQFTVNFKQRPDASGITPDTVLFAQMLLAEFTAAQPDVVDDCVVYVGHPTGWSVDDVAAYREQLGNLRFPVELVSESHSALLHVRDRATPEAPVPARALVIDIGSSTTDVTFIDDLVPHNLPVGADLGGRLIDQELAQRAGEALAGDAGFRQAVETSSGRSFFLLACRRAKEAYFGGARVGILDLREAHDERYLPIISTAWPWLKSTDVEAMVTDPNGWADRFSALLEVVRGELGPDDEPELVVLTGGGSRMAFVERLCSRVFPDARIDHDPDPTFAVARGLASNGRHRARVVEFRRAIADLLDGAPFRRSVREVVTSTLTSLAEELARDAERELERQEHRTKGLREWLNRPLDGPLASRPEEAIVLDREEMGARAVAKATESLSQMAVSMSDALLPQVSDICRVHGIDGGSVLVDIAVPDEVTNHLTQLVSKFAARVVALDRTGKMARFLGDASTQIAAQRQQLRAIKRPASGQQGAGGQGEAVAMALVLAATYGTAGAANGLTWIAKQRLRAALRSTVTSPTETTEMVEQVLRSIKAEVHARAETVERYLLA